MDNHTHGKVHPRTSAFLHFHAGTAGGGAEPEYQLSTGNDHTPMIISKTTGRTWTTSWQELLDMAIAAGVDKAEAEKP